MELYMSSLNSAVQAILKRYPRDESSLIMILQEIQEQLNHIPEEAVDEVAATLGVPRSRVYSVVSFYKTLSLTPRGKHQVDVCMGTACHVRGAGRLVDQIAGELGIPPGGTTDDLEFSLNTVHCVGACALGPVVLTDGEVHGEMTPRKVSRALDRCREAEAGRRPCPDCAEQLEPTISFPRLNSPEELHGLRSHLSNRSLEPTLSICAGSGCRALGAEALIEAFQREMAKADLEVPFRIQSNGCHGFCQEGLLVVVRPFGFLYQNVTPGDVPEIVESTLRNGQVLEKFLYKDPSTGATVRQEEEVPFYAGQERQLMNVNALIDPLCIEDAIVMGGAYRGMAKALTAMTPGEVLDEVRTAGLRGRGGAGFAAARKWASARGNAGERKYILCNADEGDPGAFMDCALLEGNPHSVIEGMIIGAYAIAGPSKKGGQTPAEGYVYVRHEYPKAVEHLETALAQARLAGLLGEDILGSGFSYDIHISRGGGAFVCGESTALMTSIEGKIGEPRAKYIHTAEAGLFGMPTVLNNVETWANVPNILRRGAAQYRSVGSEKSTGTKIFSLVGKVNNTGLVEVPMGMTLREIVYELGGGVPGGKVLKAVQTGGPSGGCVPESMLDLPVDFDELAKAGSMMGSGGMIVMDEDTCMVDVARYFIHFLQDESCGKCAACRLGLTNLEQILNRICSGGGVGKDITQMEELFDVLDNGSLCGLGKSAANPARSTLKHFREEYEAHINDKVCPAGVCRSLISYSIDETCTGCGVCLKVCPQGAIVGEKKQMHVIDQHKCDRCGLCQASCVFHSLRAS